MSTLALVLMICLLGGVFAGLIAHSKTHSAANGWVFFVLGAAFPLIGIIVACFLKAPPRPPGWYQDPWNALNVRWFDGAQWTWHSEAPADR